MKSLYYLRSQSIGARRQHHGASRSVAEDNTLEPRLDDHRGLDRATSENAYFECEACQ